MIPTALLPLPAFPLTPNGKIDRAALPAPEGRPESAVEYVVPEAGAEEALAAIFADVLRLERVGRHDSFFALGGDSILAIQVVSRAAQAGWRISPRHLFQHPTVAGLAPVAEPGTAVAAEQEPIVGPVPLTPIQRWFFDLGLPAPDHWNQALLLAVAEPLERAPVEAALAALLAHHDALRHRFQRVGGAWEQQAAPPEQLPALAWEDLTAVADEALAERITERAGAWQRSLDLAEGPLLRVAYFDLGPSREGRLLLVGHHLVVDGVSWRILLEDFRTAYGQARQGNAIRLPRKTTSLRHWSRRLAELASDLAPAEAAYWAGTTAEMPAPPLDFPAEQDLERDSASVTVRLEAEETRALLQRVPAAYGTEVNDALLTALLLAWRAWTGERALVLALEGHGREDLFDDVDLSRTVGWFTALYPLRLVLPDGDDPGEALAAVKEQIRAGPRRGVGYGLWRLGRPEIPEAPLAFNYLGQMDQALSGSGLRPAPEGVGPSRAEEGRRTHPLSVNGGILGGRLQLEWSYGSRRHRRETVTALAEGFVAALRMLIAHCDAVEAARYTPSDFPDVALSLKELDALTEEIG